MKKNERSKDNRNAEWEKLNEFKIISMCAVLLRASLAAYWGCSVVYFEMWYSAEHPQQLNDHYFGKSKSQQLQQWPSLCEIHNIVPEEAATDCDAIQ